MADDKKIIEEYKKAFSEYVKDGIIDLDSRLKTKFTFQIHRLETIVNKLKGVIPPFRQSHYFITLVKKGSGQKSVGHFTFPIKKRTLLITPKRVIHSSRYWSKCSGYILCFNLDFFLQKAFPKQHIVGKKIFKKSVKPFLTLSEGQVKKLEVIFEYIIKEHKGGLNQKNEMIAVKILELLIHCDRFFSDAHDQGCEEIYNHTIEQFNELLEKQFAVKRSVKFYAESLYLHPNHLNFLSKKHTGLTAKETINNRILMEAKYLLTSCPLSIKEIAHQLGFEYAESFHSFFKKYVQMTPSEYRLEFT